MDDPLNVMNFGPGKTAPKRLEIQGWKATKCMNSRYEKKPLICLESFFILVKKQVLVKMEESWRSKVAQLHALGKAIKVHNTMYGWRYFQIHK